jgi:cyanophycin synthetase
MKIIEIKVLRGPNYWSVRRNKLIQMKLDLEKKNRCPPMQFRVSGKGSKK